MYYIINKCIPVVKRIFKNDYVKLICNCTQFTWGVYLSRPPTRSRGIKRNSLPCFRNMFPAVCCGLMPTPSLVMIALVFGLTLNSSAQYFSTAVNGAASGTWAKAFDWNGGNKKYWVVRRQAETRSGRGRVFFIYFSFSEARKFWCSGRV